MKSLIVCIVIRHNIALTTYDVYYATGKKRSYHEYKPYTVNDALRKKEVIFYKRFEARPHLVYADVLIMPEIEKPLRNKECCKALSDAYQWTQT